MKKSRKHAHDAQNFEVVRRGQALGVLIVPRCTRITGNNRATTLREAEQKTIARFDFRIFGRDHLNCQRVLA